MSKALGVLKIEISEDQKSFEVFKLQAQGGTQGESIAPFYSFTYSDGLFHLAKTHQAFYLTTIDDTNYMFATPHEGGTDAASVYGADLLEFQQIKAEQSPVTLFQDQKKPWYLRNMPATTIFGVLPMVVNPVTYDGLDGYVDFAGLKKIESQTYAGIAGTHFRDQEGLEMWDDKGTGWVRTSIVLYSNSEPLVSKTGENPLKIGAKGYNEWLELGADAILNIGLPKDGRVLVLGPDREELLLDSVFDSKEVFAPKGSLVMCAGPAGSQFEVNLK